MQYMLRRIGFYLVALWVSVTLNFIIPRLAPGNPVQSVMARMRGKITPQTQHALEILFGLNHDPLWSQYLQYLNNLIHGNMGISIIYFPTPFIAVIGQEMPWTLALVGFSLIISFILGTLLGAVIAWKRGSMLDSISGPLLTFLSAIPYFWLALILLY